MANRFTKYQCHSANYTKHILAWSPSNTKSPGPRPTFIPSDILIHPAVWPQQTLAENREGVVPLFWGELGPHLTQCGRGLGYLHTEFHLDPSNRLATIHQRYGHTGQSDGQDRTTVRQHRTNCFTNGRPKAGATGSSKVIENYTTGYQHMRGWWRCALVSLDGVAPCQMVGVSASVNLPLHRKVQKFSSGTGSPGWSQKMAIKQLWYQHMNFH